MEIQSARFNVFVEAKTTIVVQYQIHVEKAKEIVIMIYPVKLVWSAEIAIA